MARYDLDLRAVSLSSDGGNDDGVPPVPTRLRDDRRREKIEHAVLQRREQLFQRQEDKAVSRRILDVSAPLGQETPEVPAILRRFMEWCFGDPGRVETIFFRMEDLFVANGSAPPRSPRRGGE